LLRVDVDAKGFRVLLEVEELRTEFVTRAGILRAVDGVSFTVAAGETLALVGESGCGKSATALSLMRLVPSPPGTVGGKAVRFDGVDLLTVSENEMRTLRGKSIAMIFQDPMTSLNPSLTVGLQLTETIRLHLGLGRRAARQRAAELLEMVGIPDAPNRLRDYPHQFSGGMRQRVMIAIALACDPRLILADEITTALDVTIQAQVLELLKKLVRETGTSVLLITHDLGVVAGMADRVNVMYAGRIVESAATEELFARPSMPYTWGLLDSVPRMDTSRSDKLIPIHGAPPDLVNPPAGCRFAPRCRFAREICLTGEPELAPLAESPQHTTRCWGMQAVPGGGWLIGADRHALEGAAVA
jgi:oligopeptide transport system ATP-binding protein